MSLNVVKLINPTLSEGADGNSRDLELAHIRAAIRKKIEISAGRPSRAKAHDIAVQYQMCAATVIKFAYGETMRPSTWTINKMSQEAGFRVVLVPLDADLPEGYLSLK